MFRVYFTRDLPPPEGWIPPGDPSLFKNLFTKKLPLHEKGTAPKEYFVRVADLSAPGKRWKNIEGNRTTLRIMRFFVHYKQRGIEVIMTVDDLRIFRNLPKEVRNTILAPIKNRVTLEL